MLKLNERGLKLLKQHEGKRLKPYFDTVGKITIGYGRNLTDVGISEDECERMLWSDIEKVETQLSRVLPWVDRLCAPRYAVLVNMAFNLGIVGLLEFKLTLNHLEKGRYKEASEQMLKSKWAKQVGNRAIHLARIVETGEF